jgi:hypothetical protein
MATGFYRVGASTMRAGSTSYVHGSPEFFQHPLATEHAFGVRDRVAFHSVGDVVDVLEPGLCEQVDGHGAATTGAAHDHQRVVRLRDLLHPSDEVGQWLHRELLLFGVPLVGHGDHRDLPGHRRMSHPEHLLRRPDIDDLHLVWCGLPTLVGLLCRDVEPEDSLLLGGNLRSCHLRR